MLKNPSSNGKKESYSSYLFLREKNPYEWILNVKNDVYKYKNLQTAYEAKIDKKQT